MVVALTVTPALGLILLRRAPLDRARTLRSPGCASGVYDAVLSRVVGRTVAGLRGDRRRRAGRLVLAPQLGVGSVPDVQGAGLSDALDHAPGNVDHRGAADGARGAATSCARFRASAISGPTSARHSSARRSPAELRRELDQRRPSRRLRQDASRDPARRGPDTRDVPDVQTYLRERIDEVLAGASSPIVVRIFGPDLHVLRREADRVRGAIRAFRGSPSPRPSSSRTCRRWRSRSIWPRPEVRAQAGGRAARLVDAPGKRRGRRHLSGRQGVRRGGLEHAADPQQRDRTSARSRSTRPAEARSPRNGGEGQHHSDAERDSPRERLTQDRRRRRSRGTRSRVGQPRDQRAPGAPLAAARLSRRGDGRGG